MFKSLAHWGNSEVTGRGLLALSGRGSICELVLKTGEDYIAHPRSVHLPFINTMGSDYDVATWSPTQ